MASLGHNESTMRCLLWVLCLWSILHMHLTNERQRYNVTLSLTGWARTQNDLWINDHPWICTTSNVVIVLDPCNGIPQNSIYICYIVNEWKFDLSWVNLFNINRHRFAGFCCIINDYIPHMVTENHMAYFSLGLWIVNCFFTWFDKHSKAGEAILLVVFSAGNIHFANSALY